MAYSQDIINQAEKLYTELNEHGEKVHSLREIASIINKKSRQKVDSKNKKSTTQIAKDAIAKWAKKYNWDERVNEKIQSLQKAMQDKIDADELERQALMHNSMKNLEYHRAKNEKLLEEWYQIAEAKLYFTKLHTAKKTDTKYSETEIKDRMFNESQLIQLGNILTKRQTNYENLMDTLPVEEQLKSLLQLDAEYQKEQEEILKKLDPELQNILQFEKKAQ